MNVDDAVQAAKQTKEADDWADLLPMLLLETEGGSVLMALPDFSGGREGAEMLGGALLQARVDFGEIKSLTFTHDARMRTMVPGEERPPNDNLERKWQAGGREGITECLLIHCMEEGSYFHVTQPYDAEHETWGEPMTASEGEASGLVVDTLRLGAFSITPNGTHDFVSEAAIRKARASKNGGQTA